ncbi:MAG TPA: ribulose-phosphate 3-epimerase [Candidatus Aphodomonas merdavium]|nr:ribulose-phosphate 3-epimerase [Candidatus Aphodomonas merdavium]
MKRDIQVAPSLLSCDFGRMAEDIASLERAGADMLHLDVMDGTFVPNISFGQPVIRAVRALTKLPLDVHMMVQSPERYIDEMAACGADIITVHVEATPHVHRALQRIRENGKIAGVALNPGTQAEALRYLLDEVGLVLVMTVNPGFGGQKMIPAALEKIGAVRAMLDAAGSEALLEVDGGVTAENAQLYTGPGATLLVSGTGVFHAADRAAAIAKMKVRP